MRRLKPRLTAVLLVIMLIITALPTTAFALDPSLSESRTTNSVEFGHIKFWETFNNGISGWFEVPFDAASGSVMFCVDPGFGASTDPSMYNVSIANNSDLVSLISTAQSNSKLGNASSSTLTNPNEWDDVLGSDVLETLSTSTLETIIQLMSVLHLHAELGDNKFGYPTPGTKYNSYAVFAVQNYIWHTCNPQSKGLWYKVETGLTASEAQKVKDAYYMMVQEVYDLYYAGASRLRTEDGYSTSDNFANAEKRAIFLGKSAVTKSFNLTAETQEGMQKIKYISIDDGAVQSFAVGETASSSDGNFSITHDATGFTVSLPDEKTYTVQFLTTSKKDTSATPTEDWAIYAQASSRKQSFFTAYKAPSTSALFMSFSTEPVSALTPAFPAFELTQHKSDSVGGYDADSCTPIGDTKLDATFTASYVTDMGDSGSVSDTANLYGHNASEVIEPWEEVPVVPSSVVTETEVWDTYEDTSTDPPEDVPFLAGYDWDGTASITVEEVDAPEGHFGDSSSYTHTISYHAQTRRSSPDEDFGDIEYTILVDGSDSGIHTFSDIVASWDNPIGFPGGDDEFVNTGWLGFLQIIKTMDSHDVFSESEGMGTEMYSKDSLWTIRIIDDSVYTTMTADEAADAFEGYEDCPYIKVAPDAAAQAGPMGQFANCYKVMLNGSGTPADTANPLTLGDFGQIYISGIPYGTYLLTEYKADADRYVKESTYFTISHDGQVVSTDINNTTKANVVEVVKVDSETGKTVPSANTAFRIRYMGSPEYLDPTTTPNYGRYLPNASNMNASVTDPEDYIFYTDAAGRIRIPYQLLYGSYQIEEILVPDGYYIGTYGTDGKATTASGHASYYGEDGDNLQTSGGSMAFGSRVAIYDVSGNKVDYTTDGSITYNYYTFEVTKQADHVDGEEYQTYYLTVEMENTAAKGKVQISKLGERLVGFKETTDEYGNTISTPVYESFPLEGAKFGIYAAEDILLEDGEEAPVAYDVLSDEEVALTTDVLNHIQFPGAEVIESAVHPSGAEIVYTKQRDASETNISTVEYLTPAQKGTTYQLAFSRYDEEAKITYDYEVEFALEYTAGGWNYTDIHVKRTLTADDYVSEITDALPDILNGSTPIDYSTSAVFANKNKVETNMAMVNEYDPSANHFEIQVYGTDLSVYTPVISPDDDVTQMIGTLPEIPDGYVLKEYTAAMITVESETDPTDVLVAIKNGSDEFDHWDDFDTALPADYYLPALVIPAGYSVHQVLGDRIVLENDIDINDKLVAVAKTDGSFDHWEDLDTAAYEDYWMPKYMASVVTNLPVLDAGATFKYATASKIYVDFNGEEKVIYTDATDALYYKNEDGSDISKNEPDVIPDGYEYIPVHGPILADKFDDELGDYVFKMWVKDTDTEEYRWIDCTDMAEAYKVRVQEFDITLTQHNTSTDGWTFRMDGLELTNAAANEDTATAVIVNPFDADPVISDTVGCEITTEDLTPTGNKTTLVIKHPTAPVYFKMIDGTEVDMVFLGGFTKTTITVPCDNRFPEIEYLGGKIDYLDEANGGLYPGKEVNEIVFGDYDYIRATRHEADSEHPTTYYTIELVSSATTQADAFVVKYYGTYQSTTLVVPDAVTGARRGNLQFSSIYKSMRYPLSDLVETVTSDVNGVATSSLLPLGEYVIRELEAPDGFVASSGTYPFTLAYKDQFTPLIWATTEIDNGAVNVQLDISKGFQKALNSPDYEAKAGAVFGIYTYEAIAAAYSASDPAAVDEISATTGTLIATVTTGEDGKAIESVKLPRGNYYVQELSTLEGYELNDTKFIFRADDSVKGDVLTFAYAADGIEGKITHSGYKTATVELVTYTQIPSLKMTINGIEYDTADALAESTVGNNVLVENVVDDDRSTFIITGAVGEDVVIELENGAVISLTVEDDTYSATFLDGSVPVALDTGLGTCIVTSTNPDGSVTCEYDPLVGFTGYTAESSTIYTAPQTRLKAENGTTLEYLYDLAEGVKKAVIHYPSSYKYYTDADLPTHGVEYDKGDLDFSGTVDATDKGLLDDYLNLISPLSDDQKKLADLNGDHVIDATDMDWMDEVIAATRTPGKATIQEKYLPTDAILFETSGFGNNAYTGTVVDKESRTVTVNLAALGAVKTVKVGDATATLDVNEIMLDGGSISAANTKSGAAVSDGYQPDGLTLAGKKLISGNRSMKLASAFDTAEISLDILYDHSLMGVSVEKGTMTNVWLNGVATDPVSLGTTWNMVPGNTATIIFSDNTVYHLELSNNGTITMSAENILNGALSEDGPNIPKLSVNGSESNFVDVDYNVIMQRMPMDATSIDDVRQYNTKSVTMARNDSFVKQVQVKINSGSNLINVGGSEVSDELEHSKPIENNLRPYISKVDATTAKELPGAKIEIYDADGVVIASGYSDAHGKFYFNKPEPGVYTFKEVSSPAGYDINVEIFEFTVHPDGTITGDNTIKDKRTPTPYYPPSTPETKKVTISKADVTTAKGIPGAKIEVFKEDKETLVASGITDRNGKFKFDQPKEGVYYFHEAVAPDGYLLNEEWFSFTIDSRGRITGDDTITDEKPVIHKTDATTSEGVPGAKIEILKEDKTTVVVSGITDKNGNFEFNRPKPGVYYFHETVAPDGYILNEEFFSFTVNENGTITGDLTITNQRDEVIISKVDVTTSEGVPGATIEVTDKDGNVIASGVSDENGFFGFERPEPGLYYFHEVVAPDGYILNEELFSFTVNEDNSITGDNTITNVPNTVIIQKADISTGAPIEGATIEIYDTEGKLLMVGITDKNGQCYFAAPKLGQYIYRESIAPEGYILDEGTHIIEIHADGTITGTKFTNTPDGIELEEEEPAPEQFVPRTGIADRATYLVGIIGILGLALILVIILDKKVKKLH